MSVHPSSGEDPLADCGLSPDLSTPAELAEPGGPPQPPVAGPVRRPRYRRTARTRRGVAAAELLLMAARVTPWVESELLGLRQVVPAGGVCVDIGAAAGLYTCVLARLVGASGRVHGVEPLAFAHRPWSRLVQTVHGPNVRYHGLALGPVPGAGTMNVPVGPYGLVTGRSFLDGHHRSLGSNAEFDGYITVSVEVDTLDRLCEREGTARLDFVKIDVEGAELQVLQGGSAAIEAWRPALLLEIEARHTARYKLDPSDVVAWLRHRGYSMHYWHRGRWRPTDVVRPEIRNYLFQH